MWNLSAGELIFELASSQYHIFLGKSYAKLRGYETFTLTLVPNNIYYGNGITITIFNWYRFKTSITYYLPYSQAAITVQYRSSEYSESLTFRLYYSNLHLFLFPYYDVYRTKIHVSMWVSVNVFFSYLLHYLWDSRLNLHNYPKEPFRNSEQCSVQCKIQKIKMINKCKEIVQLSIEAHTMSIHY